MEEALWGRAGAAVHICKARGGCGGCNAGRALVLGSRAHVCGRWSEWAGGVGGSVLGLTCTAGAGQRCGLSERSELQATQRCTSLLRPPPHSKGYWMAASYISRPALLQSITHRLVRDDEVGGVEALRGHVGALRAGARGDEMAAMCAVP